MRKKFYLLGIIILSVFTSLVLSQEDQKEYVISPNDVLEISVYNEPDLTKVVRVSEDGTVNYPLLGNIKVEGLSVRELENKIKELLAKDYLVDPHVSVFVKEYAKVVVLGQVKNPGSYELRGKLSVTEMIALAGGFTEVGNPAKVKIIRKIDDKEQVFEVDTTEVTERVDRSKDIILKPGDVVSVEEYGRISILGQVNKPGSYILRKDLTVLEAIALAGGFTKIAAVDGTRIIRMENNKKRILHIKISAIMKGDKSFDIILKPGDTIVVPESFF
ncbi:MAG: SLBB domain-containing protein [Candidatus Omnitrophica bacterium]|nr:SLBB domain-containing protein [Candidatus Omnitrophota bacterium]